MLSLARLHETILLFSDSYHTVVREREGELQLFRAIVETNNGRISSFASTDDQLRFPRIHIKGQPLELTL
jgi:hypothetical protein